MAGTRIPVNAWNSKEWVEVHHRTSQFPQNYREFSLKAADNTYYLGLKVNSGMGSVLNGGVEWRGSWAFSNQHFDYEIEPHGDSTLPSSSSRQHPRFAPALPRCQRLAHTTA